MGFTSVENQSQAANIITAPNSASTQNLTAYTYGIALRTDDPTTSPDWRFLGKGFGNRLLQIQSDERLRYSQTRSGGGAVNSSWVANDIFPVGPWVFVYVTYDETDGARGFIGSETSAPAELAYSTRTAGSGATLGDSGAGTHLMNTDQVGFGRSFSGDMGWFFFEASNLALVSGALAQRQRNPLKVWPDSRIIWDPEVVDGSGQLIDLSGNGNHGTVVGLARNARYPKMQRYFGDHLETRTFAAAAGGVSFSQLERGIRGLNRGLAA